MRDLGAKATASVPLAVHSITFDCADPFAIARWWCEVLGVDPCAEDHPGDPAAICDPGDGTPRLLFLAVPEEKSMKNRVHLDFRPRGRRDEEVARLVSMGARHLADFLDEQGAGWVVLADPDGNEFCIERGEEDLA